MCLPGVSVELNRGGALIVSGPFAHEDPSDELDGTVFPTGFTLKNRLEVAAVVRRLLA